jgi:hypothetical protein
MSISTRHRARIVAQVLFVKSWQATPRLRTLSDLA